MRLPHPLHFALKKLRAFPEDAPAIFKFLFRPTRVPTTFRERIAFVTRCYRISYSIECPHMEHEMIQVIAAILALDPAVPAVVVEAGSFKGGSASKLSWAVERAGRKLVIFDSFEGIPPHDERHGKNIYGGDAYFPAGSYKGGLDEVRDAITRFGRIGVCEFVKGWFDQTMPGFNRPVGVSYIDVDLASSTRTCLEYLYPLTVPGGVLFSQDGHLPWVIDLLKDETLWRGTLSVAPPPMTGLGTAKLVAVHKPPPGD
jgi:O-methyltransferase